MTSKDRLRKLTATALLVALGLVIPMVMPKIMIPPAFSVTLASHVPLFMAMFISPMVAVVVAIATAVGFLLTGMPYIIAVRALTHVIFAFVGAVILYNRPQILSSWRRFMPFNVLIGLMHSIFETLAVSVFIIATPGTNLDNNVLFSTVGLIAVAGFAHSMVDFSIAYLLGVRLAKVVKLDRFIDMQNALKKKDGAMDIELY